MHDRISDETELIQAYLAPLAAAGALGLADDAALVSVEPDSELVVSTDPIRAGVHFFPDDDPRDIAWKALAVNVSDLIAKGAVPIGYTMALALPEAPLKSWMKAFSAGLGAAQAAFGCELFGGDCDRADGPLSIAITAFGSVPRGRFVQRTTARAGDHVFITGTIGDAALGLKLRQRGDVYGAAVSPGHADALIQRYLRPAPNLKAIDIVRRFATAALDVSDWLIQDAARLARGAKSALVIPAAAVPLSAAALSVVESHPAAIQTVVSGGDDFEVLFAVAPETVPGMRAAAHACSLPVHLLGILAPGDGVILTGASGQPMALETTGYDHFRGT